MSWLLTSFGLIALGVFALIGLAIVGSFGFFLASREEFDFYRHLAIAMPVPERNLHFYGKYRWDGGFQPCFALTMPRTKTLSRCISSRALPHARPTYVHLIPLSATQTMVMLRLDREIVALTIDREKRTSCPNRFSRTLKAAMRTITFLLNFKSVLRTASLSSRSAQMAFGMFPNEQECGERTWVG